MSKLRQVDPILCLIGFVFVCAGVMVGLILPRWITQDIAAVEGMNQLTMDDLQKHPPGEPILVEGRIRTNTPLFADQYVAYHSERRERRGDETEWVKDQYVTPPLVIELQSGVVTVANDSYSLGMVKEWQEVDLAEGHRRVGGLKPADPVVVIGTLQDNEDGILVDAHVVSKGTKLSYLADQRVSIRISVGLGGISLFVGLILVIIAGRSLFGRPSLKIRQRSGVI
jgi:hypothetical protein